MAVVQNPLIGRARNSVGGTIFSTWKGKNVIRSKPLTVHNPKTDKQKAQRMALSLAVELYRKTASAIKPGFVQQAVGKSEYNAFVEVTLRDAITKTPPTAAINVTDLVFGRGTMATTPYVASGSAGLSGDIKFTWNDSVIDVGQAADDIAYAVIYSVVMEEWYVRPAIGARDDGEATISLGIETSANDQFMTFLFFTSADGKTASDSVLRGVEIEA